MIARLWRGQTVTAANTEAYFRYLTGTLFPSLKDLAGHRGAWILRREVDGRSEFLAVTLWESRQAIEAFAGAGPTEDSCRSADLLRSGFTPTESAHEHDADLEVRAPRCAARGPARLLAAQD
jgi:heme-degrading monooxygenase HmoA